VTAAARDRAGREGQVAVTKADVFSPPGDQAELENATRFTPRFDAQGLIPVVATCARSGEVLMLAYMNAEALARTIETGEAYYWSRSRDKLWRKGEVSGNAQRVVELRTDCDQDAIWLKVEMTGTEACCHTGRKTCFYRAVATGEAPSPGLTLRFVESERLFDPAEIYGHDPAATEP